MKHRIRTAGLIIKDEHILLVLHRNEVSGLELWIPAGGGLKSVDNSIFDTARREIFEETELTVQVDRISHIREFQDIDNQIHHIDFFIPVESYSGEISIKNIPAGDEDELFIKSLQWIRELDLRCITVYPEWLSSDPFWQEAQQNFRGTRYTESTSGTSALMFGYNNKNKKLDG